MSIQDKIAIVTGGNSGIGKAIVKLFLSQGAKVVSFDLEFDQYWQNANNLLLVKGDIRKIADIDSLYETTKNHFGKIDIIVANAGVGCGAPIEELTEEDVDLVIDTNYKGVFYTLQRASSHLTAPASIVLISSASIYCGFKHHTLYSSLKAGVSQMARNLAIDWAERKIRINSVSPGYVDTPVWNNARENFPGLVETLAKTTPLRPGLIKPEEIAQAVLFLASDDSSMITGTDILVDGGAVAAGSAYEIMNQAEQQAKDS